MKLLLSQKFKLMLIITLISVVSSKAQITTTGPNDCVGSITICGNANLNFDVSGNGEMEEISSLTSCGSIETNSIWLKINIVTSGTLGFILKPDNTDLQEDFDFFIFGPNSTCNDLGQTIRCSTTNPVQANLSDNLTGLNATEVDTSEGPGSNGNSFLKELTVSANETYFIVIDRPIGNSGFSLEWTGTATFPEPAIDVDTFDKNIDIEICDNTIPTNDNFAVFNLKENEDALVDGRSDIEVSYHLTESDANIGINNQPTNFTNTSNPQTLYVRVIDINSGCFNVLPFDILVKPTIDYNKPSDFIVCDDSADNNHQDGISTFDIKSKDAEILASNPKDDVQISYYKSAQDAFSKTNPIADSYTNTTAFKEVIFFRIDDLKTNKCSGVDSFDLIVNPLPQATNATLLQCDDDADNRTPFNLSQADSKLSTASPEISVSYYLTAAEAQTNINSLDKSSFTNTSNPQTVYARVENTRTGCVNFAELQLEVSSTSIPTIELNVCDDDGNQDGFHSFNLTNAIPRLTASINQAVDVKFYSNTNDALLETNELPLTITNPTAFRSEIYARVENSNNCYGINTVTLNVFRLPQTPVDETTLICTDSVANTISINSGLSLSEIPNHTYLWSTGQTTERIDVNQAGLYTVTITNQNGCSTNRNITVEASSSATISGIKTTEGFDMFSITIEAEGTGIYQYAISNPNGFMQGYQDDPNFQGIAAGLYTILVRDIKNNCGIVSQQVSVLGFPKFFTPNSDGFNDTWQVYGVNSEFYNTAQIYIFDRYGKLLKQISPTSSGWDGRYNGRLLPADDYWFSMTLEDGREYRSHFSLKR